MPVKDPWAEDPRQAAFYAKIGAEIRRLRTEFSDDTVESLGDMLGWEKARMSKVELGQQRIGLWEYLEIIYYFRDFLPKDYPGIALREHINRQRAA